MAKTRPARRVVWLATALSALAASAYADTATRLTASRTRVALPTITAHLDIRNELGEPVRRQDGLAVTARLDGREVPLSSLSTLDESGEGVAYIFLVDVSRSLHVAQFSQMRQAIETWIDALRAEDRVAVASFGERYHPLLDFTVDRHEARAVLAALGPADGHTVLHLALQDALAAAGRQDPDLPTRRVIVILSDGKDEGSGVTIDDLRSHIQAAHVPIYAIGFSNLRGDDRQRNLDALHRLATLSGGLYREAAPSALGHEYVEMRTAIRSVLVARFSCSGCQSSDEGHTLKLDVTSGGTLLSDSVLVGVRFLPWWRRMPTWSYVTGSVVVGLMVVGLLVGRRGARDDRLPSLVEAPAADGPTVPEPVPPTFPQRYQTSVDRGMPITLATVKGSNPGLVHRVTLVERARIGRSSECQVVVSDDEASLQHCELSIANGHVVLRDLGSTNGTLVNGAHVKQGRVQTGDVICVGRTELRIVIGERPQPATITDAGGHRPSRSREPLT